MLHRILKTREGYGGEYGGNILILQEDYYVAPERMTAAGRSEYVPKAANTASQGRSLNRRTEIIIMPKLGQFFKLLEPPTVSD